MSYETNSAANCNIPGPCAYPLFDLLAFRVFAVFASAFMFLSNPYHLYLFVFHFPRPECSIMFSVSPSLPRFDRSFLCVLSEEFVALPVVRLR